VDPLVSEYGIQELRQPIYLEEDFSIQHIEKQALIQLENFKSPEFVYLSTNLYRKLVATLEAQVRYTIVNPLSSGVHILSVMTSAGQLIIKQVPHLENFCWVGDETSLEQIEWIRVGMEFEKAFLGVE
jgi:hypothetical protein